MSPLFASILLRIVKAATPEGFMDHVVSLVKAASSLDMTGEQKKLQVKAQIAMLQSDLKIAVGTMSTNTINLIIEVALNYVTSKIKANG